jgi:hypothetical protein
MKLRIQRNSIRFRLGPSEVERLLSTGQVREHTAFGPEQSHRLTYVLAVSDAAAEVRAELRGSDLTVTLPAAVARRWAASDEIGIEAEQDVGGGLSGEALRLTIEKDLQCQHRANEPDTFPRGGE